MHLLFLTNASLFPPYGGERIRSGGLINALSESGYEVTAVIANEDHANLQDCKSEKVSFIQFDFYKEQTSLYAKWRGYFTLDKKLTLILENVHAEKKIDVAVIDYFFLGQYIGFLQKKQIPVIYSTHNAQARLTKQYLQATSFRLKRRLLYRIHLRHEHLYLKNADALMAVSREDQEYYSKFIRKDKIFVIPNFIDMARYKPANVKENIVVMTGNFNSFQNQRGLEWFLRDIWTEACQEKSRLLIIGKGSSKVLQLLLQRFPAKGAEAVEDVPDLTPYIAKAMAAVVPLWHGSGTRLKCIEAMALKTQVVSTSIGAQGIDHEGSILIADTPEDFRRNVMDVVNNKKDFTEKAYKICHEKYSLEMAKGRLREIVEEVDSPPLPKPLPLRGGAGGGVINNQ